MGLFNIGGLSKDTSRLSATLLVESIKRLTASEQKNAGLEAELAALRLENGELVAKLTKQRVCFCVWCGNGIPYDPNIEGEAKRVGDLAIAHDSICHSNPLVIERDSLRAQLQSANAKLAEQDRYHLQLVELTGEEYRLLVEERTSLLAKLEAAEARGKWIPCSERMPDKDGEYLVWISNDTDNADGIYLELRIYQRYWEGFDESVVTHWMPLPAPPTEPTMTQDPEVG